MSLSDFMAQLLTLCGRLRRDVSVPGKRDAVLRQARQALAMVDGYKPEDMGDEILLEIAREDLQAIIRQAGGAN